MSYARARPPSTSITTSQRIQVQPGTPISDIGQIKCQGHQKVCKRQVAGPQSKNPGRAFYACPLGRDDPDRCKFFKWEDEITGVFNTRKVSTPTSSEASRLATTVNQTLGQSPLNSYRGSKVNDSPSKSARSTASTNPRLTLGNGGNWKGKVTSEDDVDEDEDGDVGEIDWDRVDTEVLEREAIASTPSSSQRSAGYTVEKYQSSSKKGGGSSAFKERLREAVEDGLRKRKSSDESDDETMITPKKALEGNDESNPFLTTPSHATPKTPTHSLLSPTLASLADVGEHLARQDRLLRTAEVMKTGLRKTVGSLKERNRVLEARVKELEEMLRDR